MRTVSGPTLSIAIFTSGENTHKLLATKKISWRISDYRVKKGKSSEQYKLLSNDEKLSLILTKLSENEIRFKSLEEKLDTAIDQNKLGAFELTIMFQHDRIRVLEYKSIDLEARSRRKNLIFRGIAESKGESCSIVILDFLKNNLLIEDEICIDRAHRLGKYPTGQTRAIIVAFRDYTSIELILSSTRRLSNTPYGISRDYPSEITRQGKNCGHNIKNLSQKTQSNVKMLFPAKLTMNGKTISDMFPEWNEVLHTPRVGIMSTHSTTQSVPAHATTNGIQNKTSTGPVSSAMDNPTASLQPNFRP